MTFAGAPDRAKAFGIFGAIAGGGASVGLLLGGALTQALSWRWCLYVNLVIAVPTAITALRLLVNQADPERPRIDVPGVLVASGGLFALVYGFSNAETHSWSAPATIIALLAGVVLLTAFVIIEQRTDHPLLPLHVVWDRARGGRTPRSHWPDPGSSACSCFSPTTCSRTSASRRWRRAWRSCR